MFKGFDRENMDMYRHFFLYSPTAMIIVDIKTGDILDINKTAIDYYGYSADEFLGLKIFDLNPEGAQSYSAEWMKDIDRFKSLLCKHRLKDSEIRDVEVSSGIINLEGKELNILSVVDVTDKLLVEKELREYRERLELVLASTKSGIWDYDLVNDSVYVDKQWKAILGYEEHELTGGAEEWRTRWHPEDRDRITQAVQESQNGKNDHYDVEHRMRHKDGSYCWVKATGNIIYNEKGQAIRAVGTMTDITKMKETEIRILESENTLRDFAQALPDVSAIVDEDGRYIEVFGNIGYHMEPNIRMQGMTFHQLFPQDLADLMLEDVRHVVKTGEIRSMIREIYVGAEKRYFEGRTGPMQYQVNGKKTAVVVVSDITERFEVDRMLKFTYELQRKSDFINDMLSSNIAIDGNMLIMAKEIGIKLDKPVYCCLIDIREANENKNSNRNQKLSKSQMNQMVYLLSNKTNFVVWDNRDKVGVLCQGENTENSWKNTLKVASKLKEIICNAKPEFEIMIGISDIHYGTGSVKSSYREATHTLISAQCEAPDDGGIYHYKDAGLFQILSLIYGKDYASEFVRKMIGPLIEYDSVKGSNLLNTLDEILQSNNLKEAANKLFIHYKTLFFRKQRLEKILGVSLDNVDTRLALAAAIKLHKLIKINSF